MTISKKTTTVIQTVKDPHQPRTVSENGRPRHTSRSPLLILQSHLRRKREKLVQSIMAQPLLHLPTILLRMELNIVIQIPGFHNVTLTILSAQNTLTKPMVTLEWEWDGPICRQKRATVPIDSVEAKEFFEGLRSAQMAAKDTMSEDTSVAEQNN